MYQGLLLKYIPKHIMFFLGKKLIKYIYNSETDDIDDISDTEVEGSETYDKLSEFEQQSTDENHQPQENHLENHLENHENKLVQGSLTEQSNENLPYYKISNNRFTILNDNETNTYNEDGSPKSILESDNCEMDDLKKTDVYSGFELKKNLFKKRSNTLIPTGGDYMITYGSAMGKWNFSEGINGKQESLGSYLESLTSTTQSEKRYSCERTWFIANTGNSTRNVFNMPHMNWQNIMLSFSCDRLKEISGSLRSVRDAYSLIKSIELRADGQLITSLDGYGIWFWNQILGLPDYDYFNKNNMKKGNLNVFIPFDFFHRSFLRSNALQNTDIQLIIYTHAKCIINGYGDNLILSDAVEKAIWAKDWFDECYRVYSHDIYPFNVKGTHDEKNQNSYCSINIVLPYQNCYNVSGLLFYLIDENDQMIVDNSIFTSVKFRVNSNESKEKIEYIYNSVDDLLVNGFYHLGTQYSEKWEGYYWLPFARKNDHENGQYKSYSLFTFNDMVSRFSLDVDKEKYNTLKATRGELRLVIGIQKFTPFRYLHGMIGCMISDLPPPPRLLQDLQ